ncbi:MAG: hypothetical protein WBQ41_09990 [Solirubrobacterales bacterium]
MSAVWLSRDSSLELNQVNALQSVPLKRRGWSRAITFAFGALDLIALFT